jgi:hypothetical protein
LQVVFAEVADLSSEAPHLLSAIKSGYEEVFNGVVEALAS